MDKKLYLVNLYDYYGVLLTEKQQQYFENYYFDDLSLGEIAENDNVSRNAVHGQLKNVEERLQFYEKSLHLYENRGKVLNLLSQISEKEIAKDVSRMRQRAARKVDVLPCVRYADRGRLHAAAFDASDRGGAAVRCR